MDSKLETELKTAFSPSSGVLAGNVFENAEDYWGIVVGYKFGMGEFENEEEDDAGNKQVVKRVQYRMSVETKKDDDGSSQFEFYNLNPGTDGELKRDEVGALQRPHNASKWGRQEVLLQTLIKFGELDDLVGLHAHWQTKGTRITRDEIAAGKRSPRGSLPYGRYIVECDGYNNTMRRENGLQARQLEKQEVRKGTADEALELIVGKTRVDALNALSKAGMTIEYVTTESLSKFVDSGMLVLKDKVYERGPNFK